MRSHFFFKEELDGPVKSIHGFLNGLVLLYIATVAVAIWHLGCICRQGAEKSGLGQPLKSHRQCYILAAQAAGILVYLTGSHLGEDGEVQGHSSPGRRENTSAGRRTEDRGRQRCLEGVC